MSSMDVLEDADGKIFKKGDFVTFEPGSEA